MRATTIGIVGGGQLGRMLTLAAKPLGFDVVVINPQANSPAAQVGAQEIVADLYDSVALAELAERCDYITIEIEHLDVVTLQAVEMSGKPVNPSPSTIAIIQDKLWQKQLLRRAGIPVADFIEVNSLEEAQAALKQFGGKMLLKTRHGAYDGRGNRLIKRSKDLPKAIEDFGDKKLYAEAFVPFEKELAVMVARDFRGETALYPLVQTIHKDNICVEVLAPAPVKPKVRRQAYKVAKQTANILRGAGMFGIELFLTKNGQVLVNEIAPRVHNSGHFTMDATRTSQFEQHMRAISGLPLGDTRLTVPAAVMINILGKADHDTVLGGLDKALSSGHTSVHIYGKSPTKKARKMGHITATGDNLREARKRARQAERKLKI